MKWDKTIQIRDGRLVRQASFIDPYDGTHLVLLNVGNVLRLEGRDDSFVYATALRRQGGWDIELRANDPPVNIRRKTKDQAIEVMVGGGA